jgi:hypothetical protein
MLATIEADAATFQLEVGCLGRRPQQRNVVGSQRRNEILIREPRALQFTVLIGTNGLKL